MNKDAKILIVDDEPAARFGMRRALHKFGYIIEEAEDGQSALQRVEDFRPDVVLCDINMPKMNGLQFVQSLQNLESIDFLKPMVIVITAYGSERTAVAMMKAGAYDYLNKPYDVEELRLVVKNALEKRFLELENVRLRQQLLSAGKGQIIGENPLIKNVMQMIHKVAPTDVTVLLTGESGTGKELVAQTIHSNSSRVAGPFITMNCAAIPKDLVESELFGHEKGAFTGATMQRQGKFELANGGTIFLDEIADIAPRIQDGLLKAFSAKGTSSGAEVPLPEPELRVVAATNRDPVEAMAKGVIREDFFAFLNEVSFTMPPLRERKEDICLLINQFLYEFNAKSAKKVLGFTPQAMDILLSYHWPGNVIQLENVIERAFALGVEGAIDVPDLPHEISTFGEIFH